MRCSRALALLCAVSVVLLLPTTAPARSARASAAEWEMTHRINVVRSTHGLRPLRVSGRLSRSARRHSRRMLRRDVFAHASLRPRFFKPVAEVIALRRGWRLGTASTVRRWMRSRRHRAVLLYPRLRYIGAGQARGRFGRALSTTWVVRFGGRKRVSRR